MKNKIKKILFMINTSRMDKVIRVQSSVKRTFNLPQDKKGQGYNYKILCPKTVSNGGTQS